MWFIGWRQQIPRKSNGVSKDFEGASRTGCACLNVQSAGAGFMTRKTTITIETSSLLILQERNARGAWCPVCGANVEMVEVSSQEMPALDPWLRSRHVHRSETPEGVALLCLNSLLQLAQTTKPADRGFPWLPNKEKI
jgi:hypothetical protein